jgi:hypothetical protein
MSGFSPNSARKGIAASKLKSNCDAWKVGWQRAKN